jgi:hypothetical protein
LTGKKTEAQSKIEQGHRQVTRNMRSPDAFGALAQRTRIRDVTYLRSGNKIANGDRHEGGHKKEWENELAGARSRAGKRITASMLCGKETKRSSTKNWPLAARSVLLARSSVGKEIGGGGTGSRARSCADQKIKDQAGEKLERTAPAELQQHEKSDGKILSWSRNKSTGNRSQARTQTTIAQIYHIIDRK